MNLPHGEDVATAPAPAAGGSDVLDGALVVRGREQKFPQPDHETAVEPTQRAEPGELPPNLRHGLPPGLNPYLVHRESLAAGDSRRAIVGCLDRITALFADRVGVPDPGGQAFCWHLLRYQHTAVIRALITSQGWSTNYARKHLAALRGVLKTAWKLGVMNAEDYQRAVNLEPIRGSALPVGRSVAATERAALLAACVADPTPAGARDAALIAALYSTGGRRAELAAARCEDYDPGERALRITGKGDKQRLVYLTEQAAVLLGRWLAIDGRRTGPLFSPIDRWGHIRPRPIGPEAIRRAVVKRREQAGLPALTPHDFRRSFVGDLLDAGVDLSTAQELAGHATPATTARYDRRPERTRKAAVDRLQIPTLEELNGAG